MKAVIVVLVILIALMMVLCYALLVVAGRIDEQEERKMQSIDSNIDAENAKYTFGKGEADADG